MRVIVDCDPGNQVPGANVDDAFALALAIAAAGDITVDAVTVVAGNTPNRVGYVAARTLLAQLAADVPVYLGAERALVEDPGPWRRRLDRVDERSRVDSIWAGADALPPFEDAPAMHAAEFIARAAADAPGELTIVAIGPLTNIALALQLNPNLARDVERIYIMGGVFGADRDVVDTNFGFDPEAADIVLRSGAPITLIPMNVTRQTLLTIGDLDQIESFGGRFARALVPSVRPWMEYSRATRAIPGMWVHDVVAVALLLDPTLGSVQRQRVSVALGGDADGGVVRGRTELSSQRVRAEGTTDVNDTDDTCAALSRPADAGAVDVLLDIDNDRLIRLLLSRIGAGG